jgi:outer membrane protein TolC
VRSPAAINLPGWLQRLPAWFGAAVLAIGTFATASEADTGAKGYQYRGVQAPQVKSSPLFNSLNQELSRLQKELKGRSITTTLAAAIEQSLLNNPELAQSYAQIQQGQWTLVAVRRQWYPSLVATAAGPGGGLWGYAGSRTAASGTALSGTTAERSFDDGVGLAPVLSLGWTFFDPSRGPEIKAANEDLRSEQLLFNVTARNLVLQTQLSYFGLQEQLQLVKSYEQILAATSDQVKQAEALFNTGNASIADVEQIRTQQFQTLSLLISSYLGVLDAAASLAKSMALAPGQLALPGDSLDQYGQWDVTLKGTIQQAQALREEIQSSLAQANSAQWRASALFNRYWPRFSLVANGSYWNSTSRSGSSALSNPNSLQSSSWNGGLGLGFNWSIFDGGIAAAQAEANRALARQFSDQAAVQRLQVSEEVEQSYASYQTSRLALLSSRQQADSARKAALAVRERYNVGYADTTSVVQTLNQAINAANAYAGSQRVYNSAVARLYRASAQWPEHAVSFLDKRVLGLKRR